MGNVRIEKDTLGEIAVPADKLWGAQTQRSKENFKIGTEKMPLELVYGFVYIKKAAAAVNYDNGKLLKLKYEAIVYACNEVLQGGYEEHFPLVVWQTGSGTQTNMNVNEVLARLANRWLQEQGSKEIVHPNDDINMSQSSNDTFPTAMHIATYLEIKNKLIPTLVSFKDVLLQKENQFSSIIKIGRTHLQDATPLTLGQEISGWRYMIEKNTEMIQESYQHLLSLAIGGTAVGTGINATKNFGEKVAEHISNEEGIPFYSSNNKFHALTSHDEIVYVHGALKSLAVDLMKIANDVRWLASGPRCGIGEITIPVNEPGSSIMPGKVNPTQSEALTMVVAQVLGNDTTIGFAASQGNFELNVFKPVIVYNVLQTIRLLTDAITSFQDKCAVGIDANIKIIKENVQKSLMLVTALNPYIGYEKSAEIAKFAYKENLTLKEAALKLNYVTEEQIEKWLDPETMIPK